jgi:hypothetical protein
MRKTNKVSFGIGEQSFLLPQPFFRLYTNILFTDLFLLFIFDKAK